MAKAQSRTAGVLKKHEEDLLSDWMHHLQTSGSGKDSRISEKDLRGQAKEFLSLLQQAAQAGDISDMTGPHWKEIGGFLEELSKQRVMQGFSADQTAMFVFSLKKPLFNRLRTELSKEPDALADETWLATELLDKLGLQTARAFQKSREEVINRQQEELLELSTPVIKLWEGVLAVPMIGTLDSARTQLVMESLLQRIVELGAEIAIIDITGVPTVDTLVAQHLLKTVTAIRLMGADCIISGVRPQIAQTIVHLGVDLQGVTTKANLADALSLALKRSGFVVSKHKV
ncbi:MAG TPA: STAS domain-containing protein [Planctomycetaceae bacterium]|jgi:rsbT co-antagonist protein RsbR|nr:STAS domain-containing protein [Planctomycetaceae bacterium]